MTNVSKKAIIYSRQSSGKEEDSESIAFQENACRNFARAHGIEVIGCFSDANTPGRLYPTGAEELAEMDNSLRQWLRSHTTEKRYRSGLGEALALLPGVDYLIVYDVSRIYRPVQNSFLDSYINDKLISSNTELISIKEGKINFNNFTDALVSDIKAQVNDNQISITREKSKKAMARLQDDGYYCTLPKMYGIRYIGGKEREIEVIPEQAEVIRFVYDAVLKRMKYTELLNEMNTRFKGRHAGKCFYDSSWRHIVENPFYCGYMYDSHGALIKAKQMQGKEIVTYDEWRKANEIVNTPRKEATNLGRKRTIHPFSGLLFCGHCGSKMSVTEDGGKICYSCLQGVNVRHDSECGKSRTNISLVRKSENFTGLREAVLPVLLLSLYKELEMRNGMAKYRRLLEEKRIQVRNIDRKLRELADEFLDNVKTKAAYLAAYERGNERKAVLANEITQLENEMKMAGDLEKKAREYLALAEKVINNQLEEHEFFDLLHRSVNKILCFDDRLEISTVYGNFPLRRYIEHKYRNFPKFTYEIQSISQKEKITNLNDCRFKITYIYNQNETEELVVDLSVMKIYQK